MNEIKTYKETVTGIETRINKIQKEHDRQVLLQEQAERALNELGITDISKLNGEITDLEAKLETTRTKLDTYLQNFEEKLSSIEERL